MAKEKKQTKRFFARAKGSSNNAVTRQGNKSVWTTAAGTNSAISVCVFIDTKGRECFLVRHYPWFRPDGVSETIAEGVLGEECKKPSTQET